jgi:large subunit ribosomal protein L9
MEVILQENYPSLGYVGERVKVKRGYARNFLVPRGIAVEASSGSARELKHRLDMINRKRQRLLAEAQKVAKDMEGLILEFTLSSGQGGKSFGAVSIKDIENSLLAKGHKIERKQIRLPEPIKTSGEFALEVKLHSELSATITVRVAIEKPAPVKKADDDQEGGSKGGKGRRKPRKEVDFEEDS